MPNKHNLPGVHGRDVNGQNRIIEIAEGGVQGKRYRRDYMNIVSGCLAGCNCRYDQRSCFQEEIERLLKEGKVIPVCPEQLGGLPTPRNPAEIIGGDGFDVLDGKARVVVNRGKDVTEQFVTGAYQALRLAQTVGARWAVLKENSPSCGSSYIYDGTFSGSKKSGVGVTAALFMRNGIKVVSEQDEGKEWSE